MNFLDIILVLQQHAEAGIHRFRVEIDLVELDQRIGPVDGFGAAGKILILGNDINVMRHLVTIQMTRMVARDARLSAVSGCIATALYADPPAVSPAYAATSQSTDSSVTVYAQLVG